MALQHIQKKSNMDILVEAQDRVLVTLNSPPMEDRMRLDRKELNKVLGTANALSGEFAKSFAKSVPQPDFKDRVASLIGQEMTRKWERAKTDTELSEDGKKLALSLTSLLRDEINALNSAEKFFRINGEPVGKFNKSEGGMQPAPYYATSGEGFDLSFSAGKEPRFTFRKEMSKRSPPAPSYLTASYDLEGNLVSIELPSKGLENYPELKFEKTSKGIYFRPNDDELRGLVALGVIDKEKRVIGMEEMDKALKKLESHKTKKTKWRDESEVVKVAIGVEQASRFIRAVKSHEDMIRETKRLESEIRELRSHPQIEPIIRELEKEKMKSLGHLR